MEDGNLVAMRDFPDPIGRNSCSKDKSRVDEVGSMLGDDGVEQTLARLGLLGGDHRADREGAQGVGYRQRALRRVLAAGERKDVWPPLALTVDVDAANLVDERVDQPAD